MTSNRINRDFIDKWEKNYDSHENDESDYKSILDKVVDEVKSSRSLKKDTFSQIINWKSPRLKGIIKLDDYENYYKPAIDRCIAEDNLKTKLKIIISLYGIKIPSATTILHFIYPDYIPIIDYRTTETVNYFGLINFLRITESNYWIFFEVINQIKIETKASLREIDRALFSYHKTVLDSQLHSNQKENSLHDQIPNKMITKNQQVSLKNFVFISHKMSLEEFSKHLAQTYISEPYQRETFIRKGVWMKVRLNYIAALILTESGGKIFTPKEIRDTVRKELIPSICGMSDSSLSSLILTQDVHDKAKREYNNGYTCLTKVGLGQYKFIGFKNI